MKICPSCTFANMEGVFFCDDCGQPLYGSFNVVSTRKMEAVVAVAPAYTQPMEPLMRMVPTNSIVFKVHGVTEPIVLPPQNEMLLGRTDPIANIRPAIDFTTLGGVEHGVSRSHAVIRRSDNNMLLVDLGSVNGTHINGYQLTPNMPRVLHDGDEIQLGKLAMRVYFK